MFKKGKITLTTILNNTIIIVVIVFTIMRKMNKLSKWIIHKLGGYAEISELPVNNIVNIDPKTYEIIPIHGAMVCKDPSIPSKFEQKLIGNHEVEKIMISENISEELYKQDIIDFDIEFINNVGVLIGKVNILKEIKNVSI